MNARRQPLRVAVIGAAGRMGTLLCDAIEAAPDLTLAARVDVRTAGTGARAAETPGYASSLFAFVAGGIDLAVEFTRGEAPARIGPEIAKVGCAWLSGTTALTEESRAAMEAAARTVPVLSSPNMSLGAAVLQMMVDQAARLLPDDWELEIVETHHAAKLDAPSGTATSLAETWTSVRGGEAICGRSGVSGPRPAKQVGVHAVRLPGAVGEHRLIMAAKAESLELTHQVMDRAVFAAGTMTALRWLAGKGAGFYTLRDWVGDRLRQTAGG